MSIGGSSGDVRPVARAERRVSQPRLQPPRCQGHERQGWTTSKAALPHHGNRRAYAYADDRGPADYRARAVFPVIAVIAAFADCPRDLTSLIHHLADEMHVRLCTALDLQPFGQIPVYLAAVKNLDIVALL